jgi:hypothetical protein
MQPRRQQQVACRCEYRDPEQDPRDAGAQPIAHPPIDDHGADDGEWQ